eukprot:7400803-Heterocapsa_arctica.AAC.1
MVENHKDKIFQKQEEAEATKQQKKRRMDKQEQGNEQMHEYVHGGLLHRKAMEKTNKNKQAAGDQIQQNAQEVMKNVEVEIGIQENDLVNDAHKITKLTEDESTDEGEQYQEDMDTQEHRDLQRHGNNNEDIDTQEYKLVIEENKDVEQQAEDVSADDGTQKQEDIDTQ